MRLHRPSLVVTALLGVGLLPARPLRAQENYEIQVYGSETVSPGATMVELHSNYTITGRRAVVDGLLPTNHAWHETLEVTHGFTPWLEVGYYLFTSARSGQGWDFVGTHVRPRVRVPESWGWPLGVSLSQEVGYQRRAYSTARWSYELRPIIDRRLGAWYVSFNPTLERALSGPDTEAGFEFSPNALLSVDLAPRVNLGAEYYGALGPVSGFVPTAEQEHMLFGVVNLDLGPAWEFNAGFGRGLTSAGDRTLVKVILGRRMGS